MNLSFAGDMRSHSGYILEDEAIKQGGLTQEQVDNYNNALEAVKTKEYKDAPNFEVPGDKDTKGGKVKKVLERYRNKAWDNMLKSRKIRKYENADGQRWYDVFTGKTLLTETPTGDLPGLAEQQIPEQ